MAGYKKKILAFLGVFALGGGLLAVRGNRPTTAEPAIQNPTPEAGSIFAEGPGLGRAINDPGTVSRTVISICIVVALGVATIYVSKKFGARITNRPGREIHVLETAHLGPRKMIHLVRIGSQKLLVGSTSENITMLTEVTASSQDRLAGLEDSSSLPEIDAAVQ
jgi:flagellar biosynthetic protein FliO